LLFPALATRYRNDIYREAAQRDINVEGVDANASREEIRELLTHLTQF
jgi:hypothetical protein